MINIATFYTLLPAIYWQPYLIAVAFCMAFRISNICERSFFEIFQAEQLCLGDVMVSKFHFQKEKSRTWNFVSIIAEN
jgi:hypothetical protein